MTDSRSIHISTNDPILFLLWLSNIPLYIWTTSLSLNGHLGCFHARTIINSVAVNTGVHVSFCIMVFSGYMPSREIARSYGSSFFFFFSFILFFNWRIIALQYCIGFYCTRMWINHNFIYVPSWTCFHPTPLGCQRVPGWAPCVIQKLPTS